MDSLFVNPGKRRAELVPDVKTMPNPDTERPLAALARQQQNSKDVYMNFEYPLPDPKYLPVTLSAAPTYPTQRRYWMARLKRSQENRLAFLHKIVVILI